MAKRAAIYVRVSTEAQSEGASPAEQERQCREYAEDRGYQVVEVYADTARYKVRGKTVEPSGTRADRPQFRRMLADARRGAFDLIIAWREDRLYRGFSPLAAMSDLLDDTHIGVELAREQFDRKMMGLKASIAKLELDGIKERTQMGKEARLREGRLSISNPILGYDYDSVSGTMTVNEIEKATVQAIWTWYGQGVTQEEIRKRLIESGAQQKQSNCANAKRKRPWALNVIGRILGRECYHTGLWRQTQGKGSGSKHPKEYEFRIPIIIDEETRDAVKRRKAQWKGHPVGRQRQVTLLGGLVYCKACSAKAGAALINAGGKEYSYYQCSLNQRRTPEPGCYGRLRKEVVERSVLYELWYLLDTVDRFELAIKERVQQLREQERDVVVDIARLERTLDDLATERRRVVSLARKGLISDADLEEQLSIVAIQQTEAKRELEEVKLLTVGQADKLIEFANRFRQSVGKDVARLHPDYKPNGEKDENRTEDVRKTLISALIKGVTIDSEGKIHIDFVVDLRTLRPGRSKEEPLVDEDGYRVDADLLTKIIAPCYNVGNMALNRPKMDHAGEESARSSRGTDIGKRYT